jgi:hypothetical protein
MLLDGQRPSGIERSSEFIVPAKGTAERKAIIGNEDPKHPKMLARPQPRPVVKHGEWAGQERDQDDGQDIKRAPRAGRSNRWLS